VRVALPTAGISAIGASTRTGPVHIWPGIASIALAISHIVACFGRARVCRAVCAGAAPGNVLVLVWLARYAVRAVGSCVPSVADTLFNLEALWRRPGSVGAVGAAVRVWAKLGFRIRG
jgi:hypothetical protein